MEWSLISLIIGFDPIYSKMNHLKRVRGVLKMILEIFQKDSKISRIQKILNFAKNYRIIKTYRIFITIEIFETFRFYKTCIFYVLEDLIEHFTFDTFMW